MAALDELVNALEKAGFKDGPTDTAQEQADQAGMSDNGEYKVLAVLTNTKTGVSVKVEQNTSPELGGDDEVVITHPAVAVVTSEKGGATARVSQPVAVLEIVKALS